MKALVVTLERRVFSIVSEPTKIFCPIIKLYKAEWMFKLLSGAFYGLKLRALMKAYLHKHEPSLKITMNTRVPRTYGERKGCHKHNR